MSKQIYITEQELQILMEYYQTEIDSIEQSFTSHDIDIETIFNILDEAEYAKHRSNYKQFMLRLEKFKAFYDDVTDKV